MAVERYVLQSTTDVYAKPGTTDLYYEPDVLPVMEHYPYIVPVPGLRGEAAYEQDKAESERYIFTIRQETGFPITILRIPAVYGPENWMDEREGSYFARLLQGRKILVPGNGYNVLHLTHAYDLAQAYWVEREAGVIFRDFVRWTVINIQENYGCSMDKCCIIGQGKRRDQS